MFGEEDDFEDENYFEEDETALFGQLTKDERAYFQHAKSEAETAWTQIQQGRQTLTKARAKQHEVRMGRRFYHTCPCRT